MKNNTTPERLTSVDEAIHNAAKALFIKHGFGKTTIAAIARDAGVSRPTVYARVENVEQAVQKALHTEGMRIVAAVPMTATTLEDVVAAALVLCDELRANDLFSALMYSDPKMFTFQMFDKPARPHLLATQRITQLIQQVQRLQQEYGVGLDGRRIRQDDAESLAVMVVYMQQTNSFAWDAVSGLIGGDDAARQEFATQTRNYLTEL